MKKSLPLAAFTALALSMTVPAHAAGPQAQTSATASQNAQIQVRERAPAEEKGFFGRMGDSIGNVFSSDDEPSAPTPGQANTSINTRERIGSASTTRGNARTASNRHYDPVGGVLVEGRGNPHASSQRTAGGSVGNKTAIKGGADANAIAPAAGAPQRAKPTANNNQFDND